MNRNSAAIATAPAAPFQTNPKIIHRIYFENFAPYHDPFEHYLDSWHKHMPDYQVMKWNASNLDLGANDWTKKAYAEKNPVFLSEYFRWQCLAQYGGLYLDADCEILDGNTLRPIIDELFQQSDYDVFFGVEEHLNGHPTAQTVGARKGADLVTFMERLYAERLTPFWDWREQRGLIGPQLMGLYFRMNGVNTSDDGFFKNLEEPVVRHRAKVYPQTYFSPKFSLTGTVLDYVEGKTCVYHMFANSNIDFSTNKSKNKVRTAALTFEEYRNHLDKSLAYPRTFDVSHFQLDNGLFVDESIQSIGLDGLVFYGPYFSLPKGRYTASVKCDKLPSLGRIHLAVTANSGDKILNTRIFNAYAQTRGSLEIPFEIDDATLNNIEVKFSVFDIDSVSITGVSIDKADQTPQSNQKFKAGSLKILHRIYFGFDGSEDRFRRYLDSWEKQLPDFQIMHWNADNLPMDINPYVRELYKERDHAFLTDFFRWYVLREYGGSYFDADVEVVDGNIYRQLISELENDSRIEAFIGIDEKSGGWYTAHSMASKPQSDLSKFMCTVYENFGSFTAWRKKGLYFWAPQLVGLYFAHRGHNKAGMGTSPSLDGPIIQERVKIYPQDWFSPLSPSGSHQTPFMLNGLSGNTCLCHHFACTWHDSHSTYARHSKLKGGQANVLLAELIKADEQLELERREQLIRYDASERDLATVVGMKGASGIQTTHTAGCLVYGPYTSLAPNRYAVFFVLNDLVKLGDLSMDVISSFGDTCVYRGGISKSNVHDDRLEVDFVVDRPLSNVEFRLFVDKESKFSVKELLIKALD